MAVLCWSNTCSSSSSSVCVPASASVWLERRESGCGRCGESSPSIVAVAVEDSRRVCCRSVNPHRRATPREVNLSVGGSLQGTMQSGAVRSQYDITPRPDVDLGPAIGHRLLAIGWTIGRCLTATTHTAWRLHGRDVERIGLPTQGVGIFQVLFSFRPQTRSRRQARSYPSLLPNTGPRPQAPNPFSVMRSRPRRQRQPSPWPAAPSSRRPASGWAGWRPVL